MTATAAPYVLPRVPSQLIRIALEDLEKCEKDDRLLIDMPLTFHSPHADGERCIVCFAGAVIQQRLDSDIGRRLEPNDFPENECQLQALDSLRCGDAGSAARALGMKDAYRLLRFDRHVASYHRDRAAFKADMKRLADDLEAAGY